MVLSSLGFAVHEEPFSYSAFPGRWATPIAGAAIFATITVAGCLLLTRATPWASALVAVAGLALTAAFARWMLDTGVLTAPFMRTTGANLVATRATGAPRVWLVAHLDSKSQPIPSLVRVAGVTILATGVALFLTALALKLLGRESSTLTMTAVVLSVLGSLPVMASVVGARSNGAVDNASGVAAVLAAAALLPRDASVGILLPSAEELGLAGTRAFAGTHAASIALNCDGVDDEGTLVIMYNGVAPSRVVDAVRTAARCDVRVRRMPLGLLTDSTALARSGWSAVTVSHGSFATLRRVHTDHDSLEHLRGDAIERVAVTLARAAEALAT